MSAHVIALRGCGPTPLAHYLKALGVFRLVAEQKDQHARAFWKNDVFHLVSTLDENALLRFLCDEFEPTPMLSPWNGGSGFYPKDNTAALTAIADSALPRFAKFRDAINGVRAQVGSRTERPAGDEKDAMLASCQREWGEPSLDWLNAAMSLTREGAGKYPALLGTGGNDGRLDFTNNLMQRLLELIDIKTGKARAGAHDTARIALFGAIDRGLISAAIGQFHPGGVGGANAAPGFDADSLFNPWDFVLSLEGAVVLRVAALRKLDGGPSLAAAPFALHGLAGGYATATDVDDDGRGEQWMPLWGAPATFEELRRLFAEARLVSGTSRSHGALDGARAIAQLGVARGVIAFERYGFMVRNGLSNLAVPTSRIETRAMPNVDVHLVDELDHWLSALRGASQDKHAPPSFGRAFRNLQSILFDLCVRPTPSARDWCSLVEELGATEDLMVRSSRFTAERHLRPLPQLSARWLAATDDGSTESRLAASLASSRSPQREAKLDVLGPVRAHCLPLDPSKHFNAFASSDDSLRKDPRNVWTGSDVVSDLARVVVRRAMESQREAFDGLALTGVTHASIQDITAFVLGEVDDARLGRLARGLMCVQPMRAEPSPHTPLALYALFRIANLDASAATARALPTGITPRCDSQTLRLLCAGRVDDAAQLALTRVVAMGMRPKLRHAAGDARTALRLVASLAFPIGPRSLQLLLDAVTKPLDIHAAENP